MREQDDHLGLGFYIFRVEDEKKKKGGAVEDIASVD